MALQLDDTLRNGILSFILGSTSVGGFAGIGPSPTLKVFSAPITANCAAPDPAGLLGSITAPATWLVLSGTAGLAHLAGTWASTYSASGTMLSWRFYDSTGLCRMQGTVSVFGAGGDMQTLSTITTAGQPFNLTAFNMTGLGA